MAGFLLNGASGALRGSQAPTGANERNAIVRRNLGVILRRQGLRGIGVWSELAAWRASMAEQVQRRRAA